MSNRDPKSGVATPQLELDLLADAREVLERWCSGRRHRHLYPDGPNLAVVLEAWQELDRLRVVGRVRERPRPLRRRLRRLVHTLAQRDALARDRRLRWSYPPPRVRSPHVHPALIERALAQVDTDARRLVQARLDGDWILPDPGSSLAGEARREERGLDQFRDAIVNEALGHPRQLAALHPQFLLFAASPAPLVRRYPLASFFLVKLPLRLVSALVTLFFAAYVGAFMFFNDERLGEFVSDAVSGLIEGDLRMGKIHWELPLIVDLITGQPTHVVVEDISIWEANASYGGQAKRRTAWARRIEAKLVLHEIIPWNRLGVPEAIEIPWLLHLSEARSLDDAWFVVRQYDDTTDQGETRTLLSLIDAFRPSGPTDPELRGISFRIDQAHFPRSTLDVDFMHGIEGWRVATEIRDLTLELRFDAPGPAQGLGLELPLRFDVGGRATQGYFALDDIEVPFSDFAITQLACGTDDAALGDVRFAGSGLAADSPLRLDGTLARAFSRDPLPDEPAPLDAVVTYGDHAQVQLSAGSSDPRELAGHIELQLGLASGTILADDATVWADIEGPLTEPRYHLAAEGLSLDLMGEPAWVLDDVQLSVDLETGPVPDRWRDRLPNDARRLVARFDTFEGNALSGTFALDPEASEGAHVVFPESSDEAFLIAAPLELEGFDPGQLTPDDAKLSATMAGVASGRVDLHRLVLGPKPIPAPAPTAPPTPAPEPSLASPQDDLSLLLAELHLDDVKVTRSLGPASDGIPRKLRANGVVVVDADGAIDLEGLVLETDGTELEITGGVDGTLSTILPTQLRLHIDDGHAFARAFDLPPYFDTLDANLGLFGPMGAPSGRSGSLALAGVGVQGGVGTTATMSMDRGVLHIHAPRAQLFGGTGSVDADITLFERGGVAKDPRLRATVALQGVELSTLVGSGISGKGDVRLIVGNADGKAVPLSKLEVRGEASVPDLRMGGTRYRDTSVKFSLSPEAVLIEELVLPVHRAVSPFHAPAVTVPIGKIVASGSVGLGDDPELALQVTAEGVPLRLVARLLEADVPVRGQIGAGTQLAVSGTLRRPSVAGAVQLSGLSAEGIALGSGLLEVTSTDVGAVPGLAAHRELRVAGELSTPDSANSGIQWTVDALIALGEVPRGRRGSDVGLPPFDAEVAVNLDRISLDTLVRGLDRGSGEAPTVFGRLNRLGAVVVTCDPSASMISACRGADREEQSLEISLAMEDAWISGHDPTTTNPCQDPTVLCANPLKASIDWPRIVLEEPWKWQTSGTSPARVTLSGNFDLSSPTGPGASSGAVAETSAPTGAPTGAEARKSSELCEPPEPPEFNGGVAPKVARGQALAKLDGTVDMAVIADLLGSETLRAARGRLKLDLALTGPAVLTRISGQVLLPPAASDQPAESLSLDVAGLGTPVDVTVDQLDLRIDDQWLTAYEGNLRVLGENLRFGSVGPPNAREHTGFAFGGTCEGYWGLALDGTVGARIINELAGEGTATKGGVEVERLVARGRVDADDPLEFVEGEMSFGRTSLTLDLDDGLPGVELTAGRLELERCAGDKCPAEVMDGAIALYVGGRPGAKSEQRPAEALRAKVGPRGDAFAWGTAYLDPSFESVDETRVFIELEDVPYRGYDQRGRPVYEAEFTSRAVSFQGGAPLVVGGSIDVDRARYVKDAVQGVEILRFTEDVELPSAPPPGIVRELQFDLRVQTSAPLRVENNVAHGVEADAVIEITGTYDSPEFAGRIEVEPGGTVDIPFLTGTYEIQRGRVTMTHELADAEVDVLAMRRELVYIDDQSRQVYLLLGGTADAITWKCIAEGDTSGAVETQRGCLDYLVLGAGDVPASAITVQRNGGGGLANARKPLQVVGHVTEFDFGRRIEDAVPRFGPYVPDIRLRLGQIGPELEVKTPQDWLDFDYAHGTLGLDYTRGYPGFLLQQSREVTFQLQAIDRLVFEVSRDIRSYLNNRIIFDPLRQTTVEFRVDFEIPSLR